MAANTEDFVIVGAQNSEANEHISKPALSFWQDAWRRLKLNKLAAVQTAANALKKTMYKSYLASTLIPFSLITVNTSLKISLSGLALSLVLISKDNSAFLCSNSLATNLTPAC